MEIKARIISNWDNALSAARFTVGKATPDGKMPSDEWKHRMCASEHAPLREVVYRVECYGIPRRAMSHLVRHHEGIEKYVETSRPDRNPNADPNVVNVAFTVNAQAVIQISRLRLCNKAWHETRSVWIRVVSAIAEIDPIVAKYCVESCVYRNGICPETPSCGLCTTNYFQHMVDNYRKMIFKHKEQ